MNIVVCVKQVPDTTTRVQVAPDGASVDESQITFIVNPYDEFAVEEGLRLKEARGGEVTVVCLGEGRAAAAIRTCLAMGADRAVHIQDPEALGADPLGTARVLAAAIGPMKPDVVLAGKYGVGDDHSQVPSMLAELLQLPQVTGATRLEWQENAVRGSREIEGGEEIVECQLPAVVSTHKGVNEPRYASLKGIMGAKKKEVRELALADLGLDAGQTGPAGRQLVVRKVSLPPPRGEGKILSGDPAEVSKQLIELLHSEAKIL